MPKICLLAIFASLLVSTARGSCSFGQSYTAISKYGTVSKYCLFKGLKLSEGAHVKTPECEECTCTNQGLHCCGYGIKAGVIGAPNGCKVVADGCKPLLVRVDNENLDCLSGKSLIN